MKCGSSIEEGVTGVREKKEDLREVAVLVSYCFTASCYRSSG